MSGSSINIIINKMALVTINEKPRMGERSLGLLTQTAEKVANETARHWILMQLVFQNVVPEICSIIIEMYCGMYCYDVYFHGLIGFDRCSTCFHSAKTFCGLDDDCNDCICFGSIYHQCDNCHCSHFWVIVASADVKISCDNCEIDV